MIKNWKKDRTKKLQSYIKYTEESGSVMSKSDEFLVICQCTVPLNIVCILNDDGMQQGSK